MSAANLIKTITERKLNHILKMTESGPQKALLAQLRRGVGRMPGELPQLWGILLDNLPEEMTRKNGEPSKEEWAIYTALTLFALHQQGHDLPHKPMHCQGAKFGAAMARLVESPDDEERILRRFNMIATSGSIEELTNHLRGAVQLLRSKDIPLDYAQLAEDLLLYQNIRTQNHVRLRWGQDFYRERYNQDKQMEGAENNE